MEGVVDAVDNINGLILRMGSSPLNIPKFDIILNSSGPSYHTSIIAYTWEQ